MVINAEVGILLCPAEGSAVGKISSAADFSKLRIKE